MNSPLPPLPPPVPSRAPWLADLRGLIVWGFAISLVVHLAFGPLLATYKPAAGAAEEVQTISVTQKIKVVVPTPAPTPSPARPTPPPTAATPLPKPAAAAPKPRALKLNVAHVHATAAKAPSEQAYVAPVSGGSENGAPGGNGSADAKGAGQGGPDPTTAPEPAPSPTPKPACDNPHVDASVAKMAPIEYPETARELGASGAAEVQVSLTPTGAVTAVSIFRSARSPALDNEALRVARATTYNPEELDCKPVPGTYLLHVGFNLN